MFAECVLHDASFTIWIKTVTCKYDVSCIRTALFFLYFVLRLMKKMKAKVFPTFGNLYTSEDCTKPLLFPFTLTFIPSLSSTGFQFIFAWLCTIVILNTLSHPPVKFNECALTWGLKLVSLLLVWLFKMKFNVPINSMAAYCTSLPVELLRECRCPF